MRQNNRGFTLLEAMIVVAIIGIVITFAVPAYQKVIERNRIKEAAESLRADLQWMRTEAIKRSCNLTADFDNSVWSYDIYRPANTCGDTSGVDDILKTMNGSQFPGVTMGTTSFFGSGSATSIDFRRGTTSHNGGVVFNTSSYQLKVVLSKSGRVLVCNPDNNKAVPSYEGC